MTDEKASAYLRQKVLQQAREIDNTFAEVQETLDKLDSAVSLALQEIQSLFLPFLKEDTHVGMYVTIHEQFAQRIHEARNFGWDECVKEMRYMVRAGRGQELLRVLADEHARFSAPIYELNDTGDVTHAKEVQENQEEVRSE